MYLTGTKVVLDKCWGPFFTLSFVLVIFWMSISACVFCRFTTSIPVPIHKPSPGSSCGPSIVSCQPSISTQLITSVNLSSNSASPITESCLMIPLLSMHSLFWLSRWHMHWHLRCYGPSSWNIALWSYGQIWLVTLAGHRFHMGRTRGKHLSLVLCFPQCGKFQLT